MKTFAAVAALAALVAADTSKHWAVIMAGSDGFSNYRHQSDSHHAVKVMLENGIPRDQIIHLATDDIANHYWNPVKGSIFNAPTKEGTPGENVYDSTEIDYRGDQVNKENFFKVLLGDDTAPGPVLGSDEESRVFVFYVDHGGRGLICTPGASADWIYMDELDSTLQKMKTMGKFKELVFYLETCESGSMFDQLTSDGSIYAVSASNATQSSYATYCGDDATVDGQLIGSCLGDLFAVNWMNDTLAANIKTESLTSQFNKVQMKTSASPVMNFGDKSFGSEPIGEFQGTYDEPATVSEYLLHAVEQLKPVEPHHSTKVDVRDQDIDFHMTRVMTQGTPEAYADLENEINHRQFMDGLFQQDHFAENVNAPEIPQDFPCYRNMLGHVEIHCGEWSSYSLKYAAKLANACDSKSPSQLEDLKVKIEAYCASGLEFTQ